MRRIILKASAERDLKRLKRRGLSEKPFIEILTLLMNNGVLPLEPYRPHKLQGAYRGFWECHIASDWLLVYDLTPGTVVIHRTGTHADLFE